MKIIQNYQMYQTWKIFLCKGNTDVCRDAVKFTSTVTAALRVTLRDMTETYVAVAWDRAVPDDHAS